MGRNSCSIQRTVTSVDAAADFRASFKSEVAFEPQLKEKAMKKAATNKPQDAIRSKNVINLSNKARRFFAGASIAVAASLAVHGEVGNQPASGHSSSLQVQ
jgi:hypothetical protein